MDPSGGAVARFALRRTPSSADRSLGIFTFSPPEAAVHGGVGDELNEEEVFWTGDIADLCHSPNIPSTSSISSPPSTHRRHVRSISKENNFGILTALPVNGSGQSNFESHNHKASVSLSSSSPSASSSRMIPTVPKKPRRDRQQSSLNYRHSAPVSVPIMTEAMRKRLAVRQFDDIDDEDDGAEMLPPHVVVASRHSPMAACSVLEGAGRTLKGRDLRQIRNAVLQQTGLLD